MKTYANHAAYIAEFPKDVQTRLLEIRETISSVTPEAIESIKYGIPTFELNGNLVHYSANKSHIGFYPGSSPIEVFAKELKPFHTSKGTVQFPYDQKLPVDLVKRIVKFRIKENLEKRKKPVNRTSTEEVAAWPPAGLSAPAQRALASAGIKSVKQLAGFSEAEIRELHGMGPKSIPLLKEVLKTAKLSFRK